MILLFLKQQRLGLTDESLECILSMTKQHVLDFVQILLDGTPIVPRCTLRSRRELPPNISETLSRVGSCGPRTSESVAARIVSKKSVFKDKCQTRCPPTHPHRLQLLRFRPHCGALPTSTIRALAHQHFFGKDLPPRPNSLNGLAR